jgi:FkbM family methyltransferase
MQRKYIEIPNYPIIEQYFPTDFKLNKGYSRVINCGSFDGDTVKQINSLFGKIDAIACFEPDLKNYNLLTKYLKDNQKNIANEIYSFPCGVYDKDIVLNFMSGETTSSTISDKGEVHIQCVSLDNTLLGFRPTFINMDVEGVELEALKGAENILKEYKPDLAICVYHSPNHIWDIPLYLNSLNLGYKFYLRNYTGFIYETVLYAAV